MTSQKCSKRKVGLEDLKKKLYWICKKKESKIVQENVKKRKFYLKNEKKGKLGWKCKKI